MIVTLSWHAADGEHLFTRTYAVDADRLSLEAVVDTFMAIDERLRPAAHDVSDENDLVVLLAKWRQRETGP